MLAELADRDLLKLVWPGVVAADDRYGLTFGGMEILAEVERP